MKQNNQGRGGLEEVILVALVLQSWFLLSTRCHYSIDILSAVPIGVAIFRASRWLYL